MIFKLVKLGNVGYIIWSLKTNEKINGKITSNSYQAKFFS